MGLTIRIDDELKQQTSDVLAKMNIDMTTAIVLYFNEIIRTGEIPFPITTQPARIKDRKNDNLADFTEEEMREFMSLQMDWEIFRELKSSVHAPMVWYFIDHPDDEMETYFTVKIAGLEKQWGEVNSLNLKSLRENVPKLKQELAAIKQEFEEYKK